MTTRTLIFAGILALVSPCRAESVFDFPEPQVAPSPKEAARLDFAAAEKVLDFDVSPAGPEAAVLLAEGGRRRIAFWRLGEPKAHAVWPVEEGFSPRHVAWHPVERRLFLAGTKEKAWVIASVGEKEGKPLFKELYRSSREIRRLIVGPRPFQTGSVDAKGTWTPRLAYRLFFGAKLRGGASSVVSVTEAGDRAYQVVGPERGAIKWTAEREDVGPATIRADSALPLAFHPAGHLMLWEDAKGCFRVARYDSDNWSGRAEKLYGRDICGGTVSVAPNGLAAIRWRPGEKGVAVYLDGGSRLLGQAMDHSFLSTPSSVPDGKGLVGLVRGGRGESLVYAPIEVPLADVVNAWMFVQSEGDRRLLGGQGGLFRDTELDQLHSFYDSESYHCGGYDETVPTRPYYATTDVFWEVFAAAYEGTFIVQERQQAVPKFWAFVEAAGKAFPPGSKWARIFFALRSAKDASARPDTEGARILAAQGILPSSVLGGSFDYAELKPRGHYDADPDLQAYFKAFKYLTNIPLKKDDLAALRKLPAGAKSLALAWIKPYEGFISPSRSPLLWNDRFAPPAYAAHPKKEEPAFFPLAFGRDNEVLDSSVDHPGRPAAERVEGRLMPSGLDVASALGSDFAAFLLEEAGEFKRFPNLKPVLQGLRGRLAAAPAETVYDRWLSALAVQWAESAASPNGTLDERLWRTKRLQTGLASWATLRHATVLVNARSAAECGESGFEAILLRAPRGYVEPDPASFEALAGLFDSLASMIEKQDAGLFTGTLAPLEYGQEEPLRQGVLKRLKDSAAQARGFKAMAEKELRGEPLGPAEYESILYLNRVAEHHFLVYRSLADKDLALSNPDPMPKIADVAGGGPYGVDFLMAAVGRPMQWDHVVPFFGRRQVVKGAVYSYYEFPSQELLNDKDWLGRLPKQAHPAWVAPFVSTTTLPCPAQDPF